MNQLHIRRRLLAALCAAVVAGPLAAQEGTVRTIVGYPAGATSDALARVLAEHLQGTLKQSVIVENKAGAGGRIANELVTTSSPSPGYALFAPAGTPAATVERLSTAAIAAVNDPVLRKRLVDMGLEPTGHGPDQLAAVLKEDFERWRPPIKASGFKAD